MSRVRMNFVVGSLVALMAVSSAAAAQRGKERKGRARPNRRLQTLTNLLKNIELTDEQKPKVAELQKEFAPKFAALRDNQNAALTKEQKTARQDAMKKAKESGKKYAQALKEVEASLNLTEEQKKKLDDIKKQRQELNKQLRAKLLPLLTDEQKAKLPALRGQRGKKQAGERKGKGRRKKSEQ